MTNSDTMELLIDNLQPNRFLIKNLIRKMFNEGECTEAVYFQRMLFEETGIIELNASEILEGIEI